MEQTNFDALFATPDRRMENIRKWLRLLLAVHIVMLSFSALRNVVNFGKLYSWINGALDVAAIFCLLQLRKENRLYKLAAGLMVADLAVNIFSYLLYEPFIMQVLQKNMYDDSVELLIILGETTQTLLLIFSLGAVAAEYLAHRSLVKPYDPKMSKHWIYLLIAYLAVSVVVSGIGIVFKPLIESGTLSVVTYQKYIYPLLRLPGIAVSLLYMLCLYKTERKLV